jgi:hypothetical protein
MALDVPEAAAEYLAAEEAKDADALASCFTEDGTVHERGAGLSRLWFDPPMEASGGREIPIRPSDGQRSNARRLR